MKNKINTDKLNWDMEEPLGSSIAVKEPQRLPVPTEAPWWTNPNKPLNVTLGEEIGIGGIADAYNASVSIPGESPVAVAVKIPHARSKFTEEELREKMLFEQDQLEKLIAKQQELFPNSPSHFIYSRLSDLDGKPVIIMELMPKANNLVYLLEWSKDMALKHKVSNPEVMQNILEQSLETIAVAQAAGFNPVDRKGGDYYFSPDTNRLVVLDWNVSSQMTGQKEKAAIALPFVHLVKNHANLWSPEKREKAELILQRLYKKTSTAKAIDVLALVKNLDQITQEQIEKAIPMENPENEWEEFLIEKGQRELYHALRSEVEDAGETLRVIRRIMPSLFEQSYPQEVKPYFDLLLFCSDLTSVRSSDEAFDSEEYARLRQSWNQVEFVKDALFFLTNPNAMNSVRRQTLRDRITYIQNDPYIKKNYFETNHTPIPAEILRVFGTH